MKAMFTREATMRGCILWLVWSVRRGGCNGLNDVRLQQVMNKMEHDVKLLGAEVERLYHERCTMECWSACAASNFADCLSDFPNATCHGGANLNVHTCGNLSTCNSLYDYTASSVRLLSKYLVSDNGQTLDPSDPTVVHDVCWTQPLDPWWRAQRSNDSEVWAALGEAPRSMYFGTSATGLLRIYPARHSDECGVYDPRLRPWYSAASSGPKNLLLLWDISRSMAGLRFEQVKLAAARIINTTTAGDAIQIVVFDSTARLLIPEYPYLVFATEEHKTRLLQAIETLEVGDTTNFFDAFTVAFDLLDASVAHEQYACAGSRRSNTALVFFSDGGQTLPTTNTTPVLELVQARLANDTLSALNIVLLAYSVAGSGGTLHEFPAQLACAVPQGVWTNISSHVEIADSLSSYYKLFAVGLAPANFVSWVGPYTLSATNLRGVTVSVATYDRSVEPPRFLGVAAMNFGLTALVTAVGGTTADMDQAEEDLLPELTSRSTSYCPVLELDECDFEAYRLEHGFSCHGNDTMSCNRTNSSLLCDGITLPRVVWNNTDNVDKSHDEMACCSSPDEMLDTSLSQCPRPFPASRPTFTVPSSEQRTTPPASLEQRTSGSQTRGAQQWGAILGMFLYLYKEIS